MKSSYELAMERLNKTAPTTKLTAPQKKALAELDSRYAAKIAEREMALKGQIAEVREPEKKKHCAINSSKSARSSRPSLRRKRNRCGVRFQNEPLYDFTGNQAPMFTLGFSTLNPYNEPVTINQNTTRTFKLWQKH